MKERLGKYPSGVGGSEWEVVGQGLVWGQEVRSKLGLV